jgi:FKBP-type peptidyl-prolyl cis-trans isomerase
MRFLLTFLLVSCLFTAQAQSKKELAAEVNRLKEENNKQKAEIDELKKPKVIALNDRHKEASYALGILMATNFKHQGADSLDVDAMHAGLKDIYTNQTPKMDQEQSMTTFQTYMQKASAAKVEKARAANLVYLEENKKKEGVKVTASGLQYQVLKSGTGKKPGPTDQVTVHYVGKLTDGTVFDSSVERNEPATIGVNQVIPGWTEGLQLMKEGDKFLMTIPDQLAYGEQGAGGQIPPFSVLVFEVELIKVN